MIQSPSEAEDSEVRERGSVDGGRELCEEVVRQHYLGEVGEIGETWDTANLGIGTRSIMISLYLTY